jgi:hypothetical protein
MECIPPTLLVSRRSAWLNASVDRNMENIMVTLEVSRTSD